MKPGMIEAPHRRWAAGDLALESGEAIQGFEFVLLSPTASSTRHAAMPSW